MLKSCSYIHVMENNYKDTRWKIGEYRLWTLSPSIFISRSISSYSLSVSLATSLLFLCLLFLAPSPPHPFRLLRLDRLQIRLVIISKRCRYEPLRLWWSYWRRWRSQQEWWCFRQTVACSWGWRCPMDLTAWWRQSRWCWEWRLTWIPPEWRFRPLHRWSSSWIHRSHSQGNGTRSIYSREDRRAELLKNQPDDLEFASAEWRKVGEED